MRSVSVAASLLLATISIGPAIAATVHHRAVAHHAAFGAVAPVCAPAHYEGEAFDVTGLKSELMVTALSCNEQDRYNAFVAKFHPQLIDEEASLNRYFDHAYGRGAQKAHDDYITQLANVQAENGLSSGVAFCQQRMSMFDEVQVLDNATDLAGYARGKAIIQPVDYETCSAASGGGTSTRSRRAAHGAHARTHH